jgi:hypothetical protein
MREKSIRHTKRVTVEAAAPKRKKIQSFQQRTVRSLVQQIKPLLKCTVLFSTVSTVSFLSASVRIFPVCLGGVICKARQAGKARRGTSAAAEIG